MDTIVFILIVLVAVGYIGFRAKRNLDNKENPSCGCGGGGCGGGSTGGCGCGTGIDQSKEG